MGLVNSNKSKLIKILLLSCAGISLIAALAIIFTGSNHGQNDTLVSVESKNNKDNNPQNNFLKSSPSGNNSQNTRFNLDLTILGHTLRQQQQQHKRQNQQAEADDWEIETENDKKNEKHPIVRISRQGRVQGTILKSRENRNYFAFYQVPYAQPPVGKLRFALPKEPIGWRGIRDASKIGPQFLQREKYATKPNITTGSEDCLHLNIFTPKLPASTGTEDELQLPVMVYIHGGGPHGNGSRYGAKYLMDEDVVFVNIEFRLGMFGGFTAGTQEFPGNLDSRDQIMALKWVQKNIHRFGGDPKKVLLFGNSSGGGHVHAHLISQLSKGLFARAIVQSGSSIMSGLVRAEPMDIIENFILEVGCKTYNTTVDEIVTCLRQLDGRTIALSLGQAMIFGFYESQGPSQGEEDISPFLPKLPWNLLQEGNIGNHVPIIIGINSREQYHAATFFNQMLMEENTTAILNENFEDLLPLILGLPGVDDENHTMAKKFREVYFGEREISNETRYELWDIFSDRFAHGARISGMKHANITRQPVYFYWISKEPAYSYGESVKKYFPPPYGVAHADELQYLFLYDGYPEYPVGSPWFEFSKKMVQIWVSFARDGKPSIQNVAGNKENIQWDPISLEDNGMKWLQLDDEIKYVQPFTKRMELWDEYIDEFYPYD